MNDRLVMAETTAEATDAVPKPEFVMPTARILEPTLVRELIRQRQKMGIDRWDEVWEGVYVVPPSASNPHHFLASKLITILNPIIANQVRGPAQAGANVSDRRKGWEKSFRCPDVVVVLKEGKAVDCTTHWMGGPDFLIEIESPGDDTYEKIPFYSKIGVRELLIIHHDTRRLRLYRHDGKKLVQVGQADAEGGGPLESEVIPVKFLFKATKAGPRTVVQRTVVQRTGSKRKSWTV
jgi:Uma2 family endonuclease